MLFNSYEFIFIFLPITLIVFFIFGRFNSMLAAGWLTLASLGFYAWWNPIYVPLLIGSTLFNYYAGRLIARQRRWWWLALAVIANLGFLGYFKYAGFFAQTLDALTGWTLALGMIVLPLGISFFTFTQIAFLVDVFRGVVREVNPIYYALFVSYFPHLIAGPILHYKEIIPQFIVPQTYCPNINNITIGVVWFVIGLFKKAILADGVSVYVGPTFDASAPGMVLSWAGAFAYSLQLYFDFSGYSDMAIGISLLFGVRLPFNFNSPYRAHNIIEFWRRWHMTLARFLRDYLYISLGGNRRGPARRYANLLITMVLGGLWHGASWTFVVWGTLHGVYLTINHAWHAVRRGMGSDPRRDGPWVRTAGCLLTFLVVLVAWVFFRAADLTGAGRVLAGMAGVNGVGGTSVDGSECLWLAGLSCLVWFFPNTQQCLGQAEGQAMPAWRPTLVWSGVVAVVAAIALSSLERHSEFLYFQF